MLKLLMSAVLVSFAAAAHTADIVIASVGPLTGPLALNGNANLDGSRACIEEANAAGGVNGQKLRLVHADDKYQPADTVRLARMLLDQDKPVAFLNLLGSANVQALMKEKLLENSRTPAIGITPGADVLRNPGSPWIFHTQVSDSAQLRRILAHLSTIGLTRLAVAYQDSPFGHGNMKFVEEFAASQKVSIVARVAVPNPADDLKAASAALRPANAQAYLMIMAPNSGIAFVRDVRASGDATPIYGMSYVPAKEIFEKAGSGAASGIGLAQVTPNTFSSNSALVRRFQTVMAKHGARGAEPGQLHLIGYLNCRVMLEALRQAGSNPTGEKVQLAMRKVKTDLGGYHVDFTGGTEGARYIDIGVITREGRLQY